MTTIVFGHSASFSGTPARPHADVRLNPSRAGVPTHKCLVDTGADYLLLPASAARSSGLSLVSSTSLSVSTAGGAATMNLLRGVHVEIEGYAVKVDVLFDPTNRCPPLAGRGILLPAFAVGMQIDHATASHDWYWS